MHNSFYASGFLFTPSSQQILLQQLSSENEKPLWSIFSGTSLPNETPVEAFHRIICETVGVTISVDNCFPIYDYMDKEAKVPHYIFYAVVEEAVEEESLLCEQKTAWYFFRQIIKVPMKKQAKQDVTVGQRVINLAIRQLQPTS